MKLWPHQQRVVDENLKKSILGFEMRVGKSLPASIWSKHSCRNRNVIIVCPKQLVKDWVTLCPHGKVYSKENFKKSWEKIEEPTALIIDEAHTFGSALFTKSRSQLATAMYNFIKANPEMDVMLLTATPVRNDPSSFHTLLCYIGVVIPWKDWRAKFYDLKYMPFLRFPAYFPKDNWRILIRPYIEKYVNIVSLKDCVDYLPPATTEIIKVKTPKRVVPVDEITRWTDEHQWEQSAKLPVIKALGYRKIIIVAHYTAQIDALAKELATEREVFVLDGRTKDPAGTIRQAQESDQCYFIVQAQMGVGFDGWMFSAMVFASMSHRNVDHTQMFGRLRHPLHLRPLQYYYLIAGIWDQRIYDSIQLGKDMNPHKYLNDPSQLTSNQ